MGKKTLNRTLFGKPKRARKLGIVCETDVTIDFKAVFCEAVKHIEVSRDRLHCLYEHVDTLSTSVTGENF
jgi:hypothetical protein